MVCGPPLPRERRPRGRGSPKGNPQVAQGREKPPQGTWGRQKNQRDPTGDQLGSKPRGNPSANILVPAPTWLCSTKKSRGIVFTDASFIRRKLK